MELRNYLSILARRKWIILLTTIVTFGVVAVGTYLMPAKFQATTTLRVATAAQYQGPDWSFNVAYGDRMMNTLLQLISGDAVLGELQQKLGLPDVPVVKAVIVPNTELIQITVENGDPALAQKASNLWADIFISHYKQYVRNVAGSPTVSVVSPADLPDKPSSPRLALNLGLGLLLGLLGGCALALIFENMDTTLYTKEQIEIASGETTVGEIPSAKRHPSQAIFDQHSPQGEAFRRLRINLSTLDHNSPMRSILVTSPGPGDGKTTIASNLAYAVAQSKRKVLLVDCELKKPALQQRFGLPNDVGLSSVLNQESSLEKAVQQSKIPWLWVLTSGPIPPNPSELINSDQMTMLIKRAVETFDLVLLDTPALLAVKHGAVLASAVDSVMLVVGRAHEHGSSVSTACQLLHNANARSIGVIVNRAELDGKYIQLSGTASRQSQNL